MGRDLKFRMGSFYRVDDRSGFPTRAGRTQMEWTGFLVDKRLWEERQPQDLVKGVPDYQAVPDPRPLAPNQFVGPTFLQTTADYGPGATALNVNTLAGATVGAKVAVILDNGQNFYTTIASMGTDQITLAKPLPNFASDGNLVTLLTEEIPTP